MSIIKVDDGEVELEATGEPVQAIIPVAENELWEIRCTRCGNDITVDDAPLKCSICDYVRVDQTTDPARKRGLAELIATTPAYVTPTPITCGWCGGQRFGETLEDNEMQCMTCLNYVVAMNSLGEKAGDAAFLNRAARALDDGQYLTAEQLARFSRQRKL